MKFRFTCTYEYDVDPSVYGGETDPEKMLAIDMENVQDDPGWMFLIPEKLTWKGEVIEGA